MIINKFDDLTTAIKNKDIESIETWIGSANPNIQSVLKTKDPNEWTCLHFVAFYGLEQVAMLFAEHGAELDALTNQGRTPLHFVTNENIAMELLALGINVDQTDDKGLTALHLAQSPEIAQTLIDYGANIHITDIQGKTPIHWAATKNTKIVWSLVQNGGDLDAQDEKGNTALHIAALKEDLYIMRSLIAFGSDVMIKNDQGRTVSDITTHLEIKTICQKALQLDSFLFGQMNIGKADEIATNLTEYQIKILDSRLRGICQIKFLHNKVQEVLAFYQTFKALGLGPDHLMNAVFDSLVKLCEEETKNSEEADNSNGTISTIGDSSDADESDSE